MIYYTSFEVGAIERCTSILLAIPTSPHGLAVRTSPSHGGNRGSSPLGGTKQDTHKRSVQNSFAGVFFFAEKPVLGCICIEFTIFCLLLLIVVNDTLSEGSLSSPFLNLLKKPNDTTKKEFLCQTNDKERTRRKNGK